MANAAKVQMSGSSDGNAATAHVDTFARQHLPPRELWPDFIFTRPELQYPPRLNCVSYFLDRWVEEGHGDAPCVISPAVSYTYRELQALVNRIANVLVGKLGLVTGGRVLLRERIDMGCRSIVVTRARNLNLGGVGHRTLLSAWKAPGSIIWKTF